jgi:hypothetical protein
LPLISQPNMSYAEHSLGSSLSLDLNARQQRQHHFRRNGLCNNAKQAFLLYLVASILMSVIAYARAAPPEESVEIHRWMGIPIAPDQELTPSNRRKQVHRCGLLLYEIF